MLVSQAKSSKNKTIEIRNAEYITKDTIKAVAEIDYDIRIIAITSVARKVVAKMVLYVKDADKYTNKIYILIDTSPLSKITSDKKAAYYINYIQSVTFMHKSRFGPNVTILTKLENGKKPKNLKAYIQDSKTKKLLSVPCTFSKNGTVTIKTKMGGSVMLFDGAPRRK